MAKMYRVYSVIERPKQDDFWLNIGLVFPNKDDGGFNIMLQAFPLDGKIVCRAITADEEAGESVPPSRSKTNNTGRSAHPFARRT